MSAKPLIKSLSVAPMMDWTDRHCRYFHRLLAPAARLYTEMVHCAAVVRGDNARLLDNGEVQGNVALQLGGCEPAQMAAAALIGEQFGYDEININVGCPSDRVQSGRFGACLMAHPTLVAECVAAMRAKVKVPITVKTRIGIDEFDSDEYLRNFIEPVMQAGCTTFIVHARIAVLAGLSPKQNRQIPPLNYPRVFWLKEQFPSLEIIINGGVRSVADIIALGDRVDGVMVGRAAYQDPYVLVAMQQILEPERNPPDRAQIFSNLVAYAERQIAQGIPLRAVARHTLGLFQGQPGARLFRRYMSEGMHQSNANVDVLWRAFEKSQAVRISA